MKSLLSVTYQKPQLKQKAEAFSLKHSLPCTPQAETDSVLSLKFNDEYTELCDNEKQICIHVDFLSGGLAHRQKYGGGRGQSIAKAIGLKQGTPPPTVLDATAGLAKDAYVLACLGCSLTLVERSPIVAELIHDAIERAIEDEHFQTIMQKGFSLITQSSIEYLTQFANHKDAIYPDVIYLDPMYPDKKKSASVKKNMQILQTLLDKDEDTQVLLNIALKVASKRVVVKRPKGAENLTEISPTYTVESKKTRYDVYVTPKPS